MENIATKKIFIFSFEFWSNYATDKPEWVLTKFQKNLA